MEQRIYKNITSMTVNGLKTETKYYFNVIVRDKAGLKLLCSDPRNYRRYSSQCISINN